MEKLEKIEDFLLNKNEHEIRLFKLIAENASRCSNLNIWPDKAVKHSIEILSITIDALEQK